MSCKKWAKTLFWEAYEWPKCPLQTFHNRTARWMSFEEAIKPEKYSTWNWSRKYREEYKWANRVPRHSFFRAIQLWYPKEVAICRKLTIMEMYPEEYEYYINYKWDKVSFSTFHSRMRRLKDKEQAIKPFKPQHIKWPSHDQAKRIIPKSYYEIDITLKPEEAKIFHNIYRGIIDKIERQINEEENYSTIVQLESNLEQIKWEYQTFLTFNPLHHV